MSPQAHKVKNLHELEAHLETLRKNGEKDLVNIKQAARKILEQHENAKPLKLPLNSLMFTLETDASDYAYGAVLKQDDRPELFLSNTFNTTQRNYSTGDKEMLGAVKKLKYYLFGNKTIIYTDHQPNVNFLFRNPSEMSNRQKRWLEFLNQFDVRIVWTQGKDLKMADALSRAADLQINFFGLRSDWISEQMKDLTLRDIIDALNEGCQISVNLPSWWNQCYLDDDGLKIKDGKNCFAKINKFNELIVVPEHLRPKLIWEAHREYPYGHYGIKATTNCLQQSYFWPNMNQNVAETIKTCPECQKTKSINYKAGKM